MNITEDQYKKALATISEYREQLTPSVVSADFYEVIRESLLSDAAYYGQMAIKGNEKENLALMDKYYQTLLWFEENVKEGVLPLPDNIIEQLALDYLKKVGSVDKKEVIHHDFHQGVNAYRDEQKRRKLSGIVESDDDIFSATDLLKWLNDEINTLQNTGQLMWNNPEEQADTLKIAECLDKTIKYINLSLIIKSK